MKRIVIALFVVLLAVGCIVLYCKDDADKVLDADFDAAMGKNSPEWHSLCAHRGNLDRLNSLKLMYDNAKPSSVVASDEPKIPKIIHQIWLGPKSPPGYFWEYSRSWKHKNHDWEYRLWTDREVEELDFEQKDLYMRSTNWGEKSDILRAEILDRYGGLYVDCDFECLKPFEELHYKYDFYAGLEPPHEGDFTSSAPHLTVSDALIGSRPNHPIIKEWKRLMRLRWDEYELKYPDSPKRVMLRTFYTFGEAVSSRAYEENLTNIVFPATYFYPLTFTELSKGRLKKLSFIKRQVRYLLSALNIRKPAPFVEIQPETMAIHYWGNSWIKSTEERFREMYKQIVELKKEFKREMESMQAEIDALAEKEQKEEQQE